jgi:exopolysaccharide production protein ExoQ
LILTALLIAVRIFGPYIASRRNDQLPFVLFAAAFGIVLTALAITMGREIVLPLLGRESTLTGRTEHWAILATYAFKHPWLGYGYNGFWTGKGDSLRVMHSIGAGMKGADSGYMDTMLQFGLVGIVLMLVVLLVCAQNFLRLFRRNSVPLSAYWYLSIILATFVGSFTEALFLTPTGITTFIFVVACAGLSSLNQDNASLSYPNPDSLS